VYGVPECLPPNSPNRRVCSEGRNDPHTLRKRKWTVLLHLLKKLRRGRGNSPYGFYNPLQESFPRGGFTVPLGRFVPPFLRRKISGIVKKPVPDK
jgi:hypothetical protein